MEMDKEMASLHEMKVENILPLIKDKSLLSDIKKAYPVMGNKKPTSKVLAQQPFNEIDVDAYKPNARMVALKTKKDFMPFWLVSLTIFYKTYLSSKSGLCIDWSENFGSEPTEIRIKVSKMEENLYSVTVFLETGTIQCQGNSYVFWAQNVYPLLFNIANIAYNHNLAIEERTETDSIIDKIKLTNDADTGVLDSHPIIAQLHSSHLGQPENVQNCSKIQVSSVATQTSHNIQTYSFDISKLSVATQTSQTIPTDSCDNSKLSAATQTSQTFCKISTQSSAATQTPQNIQSNSNDISKLQKEFTVAIEKCENGWKKAIKVLENDLISKRIETIVENYNLRLITMKKDMENEINTLKLTIKEKNNTIKHLQDENATMSSQQGMGKKVVSNVPSHPSASSPSGSSPSGSSPSGSALKFRGKAHDLSNLHYCKFKLYNKQFYCKEQAYKWKKCIVHRKFNVASLVLKERDPNKLRSYCKFENNDTWYEVRTTVMTEIIQAAAAQFHPFRHALLNTKNSVLQENTGHPFWGCHGKNMLGKILMEVRKNLSTEIVVRTSESNSDEHNNLEKEPKVYVIGNSLLNGIREKGLQSNSKCNIELKSAQTIEAAADFIKELKKPEIVMYQLITNDVEGSKTANEIENDMLNLVDRTLQMHDNTKVVISLGHPRGDNEELHLKTQLLNSLLAIRYQGCKTVKILNNNNFLKFGQINKYLYKSSDKVQLNENGIKVFASNIKRCIKNILE